MSNMNSTFPSKRILHPIIFLFLAFVFFQSSGHARTPDAPLGIREAFSALTLDWVVSAYSPDSQFVASMVCDPNKVVVRKNDTMEDFVENYIPGKGCNIWITAIDGGPSRDLTESKGSNWAPSWSPDGRYLAFYSNRDGQNGLWLWETGSDAIRKASNATTRHYLGKEVAIWTPDSKYLVQRVKPEESDTSEIASGGSQEQAAAEWKEPGSTVTVLRSPKTEVTTIEDKKTRFGDKISDIGLIEVETGGLRRLAQGVTFNSWISPDGRQVAFLDARNDWYEHTLVTVELATGKTTDLVSGIGQSPNSALTWSPDSKWLAYFSSDPKEENALEGTEVDLSKIGLGDLFFVSAAGGAPQRFTGSPGDFRMLISPLWGLESKNLYISGSDHLWKANIESGEVHQLTRDTRLLTSIVKTAAGNVIYSPDKGRSLYAMTFNRQTKKQGFTRVDLKTGQSVQAVEGDKKFSTAVTTASPDGRYFCYTSASSSESSALWIVDGQFDNPQRLMTPNPQFDKYRFGETRLIEFQSSDGKPLKARLSLPANYEPGKRYPLVVRVYASSMGSNGVSGFSLSTHLLTTRGYAVLSPDIPVHVGTPVQDIMKTVMPAIDKTIEMGVTDPDRLAVMGSSNGGYTTLALITQTKRFKAAVMAAGFGNLIAFYGAGQGSWIKWLEEQGGSMGAAPWEAPLRYVENSPIFYLDRIETPLIIQAGVADKTFKDLSDEVWVGLQHLGKDVTYLQYGGEGHGLSSAPNRIDYWTRVLAFYEKHLKFPDPQPETK